MKIAVLFRGPLRPNPASVEQKLRWFMQQFNGAQAEIHTYLATWRNWHHHKASDLMNLDLFDNVLMQTEPNAEQAKRCTQLRELRNGSVIQNVFNMYYQSKTAIDFICDANDYDYIVHTRTDLYMALGDVGKWFDPGYYVAPHVHPNPWMCDQFGVAPAAMMQKAWDYGTLDNLNRLFEAAAIPESVLQTMIDEAGIPVRTEQYAHWELDSMRSTA